MENKYEKPQIFFEEIKMTTSVSACDLIDYGTGGGYQEPDYVGDNSFIYVNVSDGSVCTDNPFYCYHHPDDKDAFMVTNLS